jgi:hypothetical protein
MQGMGNHVKRALNAIYFSPANSWSHERAKAEVCYNLLKEKKWFITEAVDNKTGLRRDVVCLDDGIIYEVETDPKRAERFLNDPDKDMIVVIKLWEVK